MTAVCDLKPDRLSLERRRDRNVRLTTDYEEILRDGSIEGVMIASPIETHHDLALRCLTAAKHVFVEKPMARTDVRAIGRDSIVRGEWDVVFIDLGYPAGTLVRVELSWLAPSKIRRTVIAGRHGMLVYEDASPEPIRIHDCSVEVVDGENFGAHQMAYRTGGILSPRLSTEEPLRAEVADFGQSIRSDSHRARTCILVWRSSAWSKLPSSRYTAVARLSRSTCRRTSHA